MSKKPPTVRKPIEFPDPDQHTAKRDLYKEIRDCLISLRVLLRKDGERNTMISFSNVINPGSFIDEGRLPYIPRSGKSRKKKLSECLFVLVYKTIMAYWTFATALKNGQEADETSVTKLLAVLKEIQRKGLNAYQIEGSEARGYSIVIEEVEDEDEDKAEGVDGAE